MRKNDNVYAVLKKKEKKKVVHEREQSMRLKMNVVLKKKEGKTKPGRLFQIVANPPINPATNTQIPIDPTELDACAPLRLVTDILGFEFELVLVVVPFPPV